MLTVPYTTRRARRSCESRRDPYRRHLFQEQLQVREMLATYLPNESAAEAETATVTEDVTGLATTAEMERYRSIDVNCDGYSSPIDALAVINALNAHGMCQVYPQTDRPGTLDVSKYDVNNDEYLSPADAPMLVNDLLRNGTYELPRYWTSDPLANDESLRSLGVAQTPVVSIGLSDDGRLAIIGTDNADDVRIESKGERIIVRESTGQSERTHYFRRPEVDRIVFSGRDGNDLFVNETDIAVVTQGGAGDDTLIRVRGNPQLCTGAGFSEMCKQSGERRLKQSSGSSPSNMSRLTYIGRAVRFRRMPAPEHAACQKCPVRDTKRITKGITDAKKLLKGSRC
jgi:hypothetical protein